jgi:hypothetical protein
MCVNIIPNDVLTCVIPKFLHARDLLSLNMVCHATLLDNDIMESIRSVYILGVRETGKLLIRYAYIGKNLTDLVDQFLSNNNNRLYEFDYCKTTYGRVFSFTDATPLNWLSNTPPFIEGSGKYICSDLRTWGSINRKFYTISPQGNKNHDISKLDEIFSVQSKSYGKKYIHIEYTECALVNRFNSF